MVSEENFIKAIKEIRKIEKKVNFDQTADLIINLKNFDVRREAFSIFITLPVKIKQRKVAGFFEKNSDLVYTITKNDFNKYKEKKDARKLIQAYDFFIASAKLMPAIATSFGRILGPSGKMPSPQLGILPSEDEKMIKAILERINSTVRIKVKEPSIKTGIAKESMKDEDIAKNAFAAYSKITETLPKKIENIRNVKIKFSMGKPVKVEI